MPRYRLRYRSSNLEMPLGDFVIGRSSECHLSIDDPSVSRRHAVIHVAPATATLEDLGSRNGVRINGRAPPDHARLQHLDRIAIGNQELLFLDADQGGAAVATSADATRMTLELRGGPGPGEGFDIVAGIAEKALVMGSFERAEQVLTPFLDAVLETAKREGAVAEEPLMRALTFAMRLAEERNTRRWLHWIFEVHTAAKTLMSAETIERLHEVVRKTRYDDSRAIRNYLLALGALNSRLTAADRFLIKRLEALQRVITA